MSQQQDSDGSIPLANTTTATKTTIPSPRTLADQAFDLTTNADSQSSQSSATANAAEEQDKTHSPIRDFYNNATILITGGTGFVGKVLIEKLLRTFELQKIFMLIRVKDDGMNVQERLEDFFEETIFDKIRSEQSELFEKVQPIRADYSANDLDIARDDREILCSQVEIVFNVVASVKFNEKLSDAIDINVLGTKKILDLVMDMKKLKSFVHISTLYCNCERKFIKEQVYESEIGYEKIMQVFRIFDDKTLEKFRHCLIGEMPNTYTMTKKCAENLVNHRAFYLPAGIFRPPIVMSTYKDPFPGWTDNLYGPSGLCTWSARGLVHCIYGRPSCKANLVPVDYCVNAMIASAWDVSRRYLLRQQDNERTSGGGELPVYNYICDHNNLTWGQYMHLARKGFHEPFDKALWCFSYIIIPSKPLYDAVAFFLHDIPGYILDLIAAVTGQKRIYSKAYRKISAVMSMMSWFGLKEWQFAHQNIDDLDRRLVGAERRLLQFNMASINWSEYFETYLSGIRKYYFKESSHHNNNSNSSSSNSSSNNSNNSNKNDSLNEMQQRKTFYSRMLFLHHLLKGSFGLCLMLCIIKLYSKICKIIPKIIF